MLLRRHRRVAQKSNTRASEPIRPKVSLDEFTVAELRDMARDNKIAGYSTMNKAELVKSLE